MKRAWSRDKCGSACELLDYSCNDERVRVASTVYLRLCSFYVLYIPLGLELLINLSRRPYCQLLPPFLTASEIPVRYTLHDGSVCKRLWRKSSDAQDALAPRYSHPRGNYAVLARIGKIYTIPYRLSMEASYIAERFSDSLQSTAGTIFSLRRSAIKP